MIYMFMGAASAAAAAPSSTTPSCVLDSTYTPFSIGERRQSFLNTRNVSREHPMKPRCASSASLQCVQCSTAPQPPKTCGQSDDEHEYVLFSLFHNTRAKTMEKPTRTSSIHSAHRSMMTGQHKQANNSVCTCIPQSPS